MGLKAAIQALQKAEQLKEKVQSSGDLLNDNDAWICQQQLQRIYQQVLILDLEYALDRKVEQDLWSLGFKNYIAILQSLAKNKKNPKRSESQAMLSWCLEAASGFYLTLLQDICTAFDLDLPFRRKGSVYGSSQQWKTIDELNPPHHSSCNYICQHCLVHLGDIARYRNQSRQAEAFYRHAVLPAPSNGHPYNQLALLEATRGDRLSTVFHYVRSVAVRCPFQAAATNLARTLGKSVEEKVNVEARSKLSSSEYVSVFLKLHGLLHASADLNVADKCVKLLTSTLTALVATESLTSWKLVQMLVINCFALSNAGGCIESGRVTMFPNEALAADERRVKSLVVDLMAGTLSAYLLPVYTLKEGEALLEYFALPAIKLTLDWIRLEPAVLADPAFTGRLQIWPSLCKLLNGLQPALVDFNVDEYTQVALPEERDVQCFLPLEKSLVGLRFGNNEWKSDANKLRAARLVAFGRWLAARTELRLITVAGDTFQAVGGQQAPSSELLREMSELKLASPALSDTSSWGSSSATTPDNPSPLDQVQAAHELVPERRAGILKPQGSLEKYREKEAEPSEIMSPAVAVKRGRQNVAMQAILRKAGLNDADNASKQVTFKSPPPVAVVEKPKRKIPGYQPVSYQGPASYSFTNPPPPIQQPPWMNSLDQNHLQYQNPAQFAVPPPVQYTPWEALPMPPSAWCPQQNSAMEQRRVSRPPGMMDAPEHTGYSHGRATEETYGWNARQAPERNVIGESHFGVQRGERREPHNMFQDRHEDLTMFSSGSGGGAFTAGAGNTYSLFSSPSWAAPTMRTDSVADQRAMPTGQQSLWSGPGPSPLERLLEQQKQLREGPGPKSGT